MKDEKKLYEKINLKDGPIKIMQKLSDKDSDYYLMNSMTNSTFKVKVNGKWRVIRIPGYGTEEFINRKNEKEVLNILSVGHYKYLPKIIYSDNRGVVVTEFLENYHVLSKEDFTSNVAFMLSKLHKMKSKYMDKIMIDLLQELQEYLSISKELVLNGTDFEGRNYTYEHEVIQFIGEHQHENLAICHRDMMYNNIMIPDSSESDLPKFIDWEYSGVFNRLWDIGCFISEYRLWYDKVDLSFIKEYNANSDVVFTEKEVMQWSAVVDYIWSMWSLAKTQLGEDNMEYGQDRYNRFIAVWRANREKEE